MIVKKERSIAINEAKSRKEIKPVSSEKQLKIKLVRSPIGYPKKQREIIKGLGLRKMNSEIIRKDCPEIRGMVNKVSHLLKVESLEKK